MTDDKIMEWVFRSGVRWLCANEGVADAPAVQQGVGTSEQMIYFSYDYGDCSICGEPLAGEQELHSDEDGYDCHAGCCPVCKKEETMIIEFPKTYKVTPFANPSNKIIIDVEVPKDYEEAIQVALLRQEWVRKIDVAPGPVIAVYVSGAYKITEAQAVDALKRLCAFVLGQTAPKETSASDVDYAYIGNVPQYVLRIKSLQDKLRDLVQCRGLEDWYDASAMNDLANVVALLEDALVILEPESESESADVAPDGPYDDQ